MRPKLLLAAIFGLVTSSCFSPGDGQAPPLTTLYFPTGLALDVPKPVVTPDGMEPAPAAPKYLYIASSDFDLQYRSSALVSYDLDLVRNLVPESCTKNTDCESNACDTAGDASGDGPTYFCLANTSADPCGKFGEHSAADKLLYPGRCNYIDPNKPQDGSATILHDKVGIGAFATDIIFRRNPDDAATYPGRLFLPVRGDATLHWIDLDDGKFVCGQGETDDDSCDDQHRAGNSVFADTNQLRLPAEPFGVDATSDGSYVAVTNQTTGSVSLFFNDWSPAVGARLEYILGGLPSAPVAIAALPNLLSKDPAPGFLVAYSNAAQIDLLRVRADIADTPDYAIPQYPRYVLAAAGTTPITANSLGFDSRGLVIESTAWQACKASCDARDDLCAAACMKTAAQPDVYLANRAPASLLVGSMTPDQAFAEGSNELPAFYDSIPLVTGPSRVLLGNVKVPLTADNVEAGNDGVNGGKYALEPRVFVVCFDSRRIYVYDPTRRVIDAIIPTGRGPFALAIDDVRGLGYVAHFTDSYLGVISLDQRFPQTYASIVASIGNPMPPRASK